MSDDPIVSFGRTLYAMQLESQARIAALRSVIVELLAAKEGVAPEEALKWIESHEKVSLDEYLKRAEEKNPSLAGYLDLRKPEDMPDDEAEV
jgi:hypothetical protein